LIAIDSNILIYAHRQDSKFHFPAKQALESLISSAGMWAITWPSVHEFIAVSTHPRVYSPPSTLLQAIEQMEIWMSTPNIRLLGETPSYWEELKTLALQSKISGPPIHDARIAAICLQHGVSELWTADRDFSRFPKLKTRNPLVVD
jgi:uncharacterized protein